MFFPCFWAKKVVPSVFWLEKSVFPCFGNVSVFFEKNILVTLCFSEEEEDEERPRPCKDLKRYFLTPQMADKIQSQSKIKSYNSAHDTQGKKRRADCSFSLKKLIQKYELVV